MIAEGQGWLGQGVGVITKGRRGRDDCGDGTVLQLDCGGVYINVLVIKDE